MLQDVYGKLKKMIKRAAMEPFKRFAKEFFSIIEWMEMFPGLTSGFTTRNGGVSAGQVNGLNFGYHVKDEQKNVTRNRKSLSKSIGFPLHTWVGAEQTHETKIQRITSGDRGMGASSYDTSFKGIDGFYTSESGILLTMCFADCVPLFFIYPEKRWIGIAHAGWRGTVGNIAGEMVSSLVSHGAASEGILAAIGPSICKTCYIVDERIIELVENVLERVDKKPYNQISGGQYALDLKEVNRLMLLKAGLKEEHILVTGHCTSCSNEIFYSHRKEKFSAGRMAAFIGWKEAF
ncbi:peptidoglycan editing factor PgeF [Bacillus massilinigeriensis]|uniref:peptidoglycan editing factor PgeF n=1 Tax=Bacillus mediterraneensis TaxID=1805474 RepID=UPI000AAF4CC5|nr:peptidoglycan editing factor PgeF [Bacillus mediterraneensis]